MEHELAGTPLHARLSSLRAVCGEIDAAQEAFLRAAASKSAAPACPPGCSSCCRGFVPDLLPLEADGIAYFLVAERVDLLERWERLSDEGGGPGATCAFHDPDNPSGCCSIYPARPLICRFFGFSASGGRSGEPRFALCRWMPSPPGLAARSLEGAAALRGAFGSPPPAMADFARRILAIEPDGAATRGSLHEALPRALSRVSLTLRFARGARTEKEPDPGLPRPA